VADGAALRAYVEGAVAELGGLDVLVNNTSGFGMGNDEAAWEAGLSVDIMATVRATQAALRTLERSTGSSVINISSISGFRPSLRAPGYAAVKAAMINITTSQAAALARKGIRVNCIAPGRSSLRVALGGKATRAGSALCAGAGADSVRPPRRAGEIAEVALFLASSHARWITGQTIAVDGGQLLG
jgi:3-oxoacyl-[acyl-carrier protein] reductase